MSTHNVSNGKAIVQLQTPNPKPKRRDKPTSHANHSNRLYRWIKHVFVWLPAYRRAFNPTCLSAITQAVKQCEEGTDVQVCVMVEHTLPLSYIHKRLSCRDRATTLFGKHRVWDTAHNTGVLIYLNWVEHAVEIIADRALANAIAQNQWNAWAVQLQAACARSQYQAGVLGVLQAMHPVFAKVLPTQHATMHNALDDAPIVL